MGNASILPLSRQCARMPRRAALAVMGGALAWSAGALSTPGPSLDRLALTTVSLRDRIPFKGAKPAGGAVLPLEDAARFIRAIFGIRQVELWSLQFADQSDAYCALLRQRAQQAGCRICNIQCDGGYDFSNPDAAARKASVAFVMAWIRRAALVGSPSIRLNTDAGKPGDRFDPSILVPIYRRLADYGATLGVKILVENHIGESRTITKIADLLNLIDHPNVGSIADWGNSPAASFEQRLADLSLLFSRLALVSAKGLHFDAAGRHVEYPIAPLVQATERAGFRGLYSIELYTDRDPPEPIAAIRAMIAAISDALAQGRNPR